MMARSFSYHLYLVISEATCKGRDPLWVAEQAIRGGVDLVQLREKNISTAAYTAKALRLKEITDRYNVPLIINDDVTVMEQADALGVHVGNSDLAPVEIRKRFGDKYMIGYSLEHADHITSLNAEHSDYIAASPVFSTYTKTDTITEWGLEGVSSIRQHTTKPLIAIGNMNRKNAASVLRAGADCLAVVSAVCSADDPYDAAAELKHIILHEKKV